MTSRHSCLTSVKRQYWKCFLRYSWIFTHTMVWYISIRYKQEVAVLTCIHTLLETASLPLIHCSTLLAYKSKNKCLLCVWPQVEWVEVISLDLFAMTFPYHSCLEINKRRSESTVLHLPVLPPTVTVGISNLFVIADLMCPPVACTVI